MVLGFKPQFKQPVIDGDKIHSIREDSTNRWKAGNSIHFAVGVRTKQYNQFKPTGKCYSTQKVEFKWKHNNIGMVNQSWSVQVFIDGVDVTVKGDIVDDLIKNDGFKTRKEFFEWSSWFRKNFKGKIIHWTDFKYQTK